MDGVWNFRVVCEVGAEKWPMLVCVHVLSMWWIVASFAGVGAVYVYDVSGGREEGRRG